MEAVENSAMLDGDALAAVNPSPPSSALLHETIRLLIDHYRRYGYRHFFVNHLWTDPKQCAALQQQLLTTDPDVRCFRLTLSAQENRRRIQQRRPARLLDHAAEEFDTNAAERRLLADRQDLGEPFDVSDPPDRLVGRLLRTLTTTSED